jgi:hypothetical protein
MKKDGKLLSEILFFGALWGFLEATLGYLLHSLTILAAGTVMFAVATFIMLRAHQRSECRRVLLMIGLVAALIKAVDFFLPPHPIYGYVKVVNPMFCIVAETLVLTVVIPWVRSARLLPAFGGILAASLVWRVVFLGYLVGQDAWFGTVSTQLHSWDAALRFLGTDGLISAGLGIGAYGLHRLWSRGIKSVTLPRLVALSMVILAILATILL